MEQHPIPQNVSSYQFKLVGDMTLKQFFQLAGGLLAAIIFWSSPLLGIIKWPLAILSGLLGVGLAFLPLEERPLERWIFAFFRAIYSPTVFSWKKSATSVKLFQDEPAEAAAPEQNPALKDYLAKTNQTPTALGNLDKAEDSFLAKLAGLFSVAPATTSTAIPTGAQTQSPPTQIMQTPSPTTTVTQVTTPMAHFVTPPEPTTDNEIPVQTTGPKVLEIPVTTSLSVPASPHMIIEETAAAPQNPTSNSVSEVVAGNEMVSTRQAIFSIDAAPPSPPTYPNVVVGQIVDQDRRIVEGAIMEIRDSAGRPIRALRSNKAGHFITVTQLDNGHYEIITDKEGYEFTPMSFDATGSLIPPILVQGKRLSPLIAMPEVPVKPAYSIN